MFGGNLVVENVDALIIIDTQASASPHNGTTQICISLHVGQEQNCKEIIKHEITSCGKTSANISCSIKGIENNLNEGSYNTGVPFIIWFIQWVFRHTLQEQLKNGSGILFPIMAEHMHW